MSAVIVPVWQAGPAAGVALLDRLVSELESALQAARTVAPFASQPPPAPPLVSGRGPVSNAAASLSPAPPSEPTPLGVITADVVRLAGQILHLLLCVGGGLAVLQQRRSGGLQASIQTGGGEVGHSSANVPELLALGRLGLRSARAFALLLKVGSQETILSARTAYLDICTYSYFLTVHACELNCASRSTMRPPMRSPMRPPEAIKFTTRLCRLRA